MDAKKRTRVMCFGVFFVVLSLSACAFRGVPKSGSWVEEKDRISIKDSAPSKGVWQTQDVTIEYLFRKNTQGLQVSGGVRLGNHLINGFNTLEHFTLGIYLLDARGLVLDSTLLRTGRYRQSIDGREKMTFDKQLALPGGTAAIAFGYSGRATEGGTGTQDQIDWTFWKRPGHPSSE